VDAAFDGGSITVVYGANGAGKSTLMGIVGGLVQPNAGRVTWEPDGTVVADRREAIGWVGHESSSYRELTVEENVAFVATVHGVDTGIVREGLERGGASDYVDRRVGTLSRGQKQWVALARGIVHSPDLLLLDEPFTGLDARGSEMLESVLLEERVRGAIVIVMSHDLELAKRLSARSLWIERGRVRASVPESPS
jgi:heme exporter protein A